MGNDPVNFSDPSGLGAIKAADFSYSVVSSTAGTFFGGNTFNQGVASLSEGNYATGSLQIAQSLGEAALGVLTLGEGTALYNSARIALTTTSASTRAQQFSRALSTRTQGSTTAAVTETREGVRIISSSESGLRPAQRELLQKGDIAVTGVGHAEVTGVNAARKLGLTPTGTAASRPICPECASVLSLTLATGFRGFHRGRPGRVVPVRGYPEPFWSR